MSEKKKPTIYTLREVEEILNVTQRTLYRWIDNGSLKAFKAGRTWRVSEEALQEFIEQGGTKQFYFDKYTFAEVKNTMYHYVIY